MKLTQLKEAAERAIEYARECGEDPDEIPVTLQIDRENENPIWSDVAVELHYDNNTFASGCVISACIDQANEASAGRQAATSSPDYRAAVAVYTDRDGHRCIDVEADGLKIYTVQDEGRFIVLVIEQGGRTLHHGTIAPYQSKKVLST